MTERFWRNEHEYEGLGEGIGGCKVCHTAEGTLTVDCPGLPVPAPIQDRVHAGQLDFMGGRWWIPFGVFDRRTVAAISADLRMYFALDYGSGICKHGNSIPDPDCGCGV